MKNNLKEAEGKQVSIFSCYRTWFLYRNSSFLYIQYFQIGAQFLKKEKKKEIIYLPYFGIPQLLADSLLVASFCVFSSVMHMCGCPFLTCTIVSTEMIV